MNEMKTKERTKCFFAEEAHSIKEKGEKKTLGLLAKGITNTYLKKKRFTVTKDLTQALFRYTYTSSTRSSNKVNWSGHEVGSYLLTVSTYHFKHPPNYPLAIHTRRGSERHVYCNDLLRT